MPIPEKIDHPLHYGGDTVYETVKVIQAWRLGYLLGNVVKYLSRAGRKEFVSELEDLKKARWYLDARIRELEPNANASMPAAELSASSGALPLQG